MKRPFHARHLPSSCSSSTRKLRCEPLEDRRMLSVLFVDDDAPTGGNGLAWDSAYNDLQDALSQAATLKADADPANDVDQIWIAEGVYKPSAELEPGVARSASFSLVNGVTLYGGFDGSEATREERDVAAHVTTLSGDIGVASEVDDNVYRVIYCAPDVVATLDGVTVTGGDTSGQDNWDDLVTMCGGGVLNAGTLTVANSIISANRASQDGGGIYNNAGTLTVTNSMFLGNSANSEGGGIHNDEGTTTIVNSLLVGNEADYAGGGIFNDAAGVLSITNCTLSRNETESNHFGGGGGIYNAGSGVLTLNNSIVAKNTASCGPDIRWSGDDGTIPFDFIIELPVNIGPDELPGRISATRPSGVLSGSHNLIGNGAGQTVLVDGVDGNLVGSFGNPVDPLFVENPSDGGDGWEDDAYTSNIDESANNDYGDLRLLDDSPAVDSGDNGLLPADTDDGDGDRDTTELIPFDLARDSRIQDGNDDETATVNMGAYETTGGTIPDRRVLYVNPAVVNSGDGLDWATAFSDLQDALAQAAVFNLDSTRVNDVGQIWIAEGVYTPSAELQPGDPRSATFSLVDGVTLLGGFAGTETAVEERDLSTHVSTLSGDLGILGDTADNAYTVVSCGENVVASFDAVNVTGGNADATVLSSDFNGNSGGGVFNAGILKIANSTLSGNSVNSARGDGGAIYNAGALMITNSTISDNSVGGDWGTGGGIYNSGVLTIVNGTISGNSTHGGWGDGGGISNTGTLAVSGSTILENAATDRRGDGGGIHNSGSATITGSTVSGNSAQDGAGVFNRGTLTVKDSAILENTSYFEGGGIYNCGTFDVTNSMLAENVSDRNGGAIYNIGTLRVAGGTFLGNVAQHGAGISNGDEFLTGIGTCPFTCFLEVNNSTFHGNRAGRAGGGIWSERGTATVTNSVFSANFARRGGGLCNEEGALTVANCTITENGGGGIGGYSGTLTLDNSILWHNAEGNLIGYDRYESLSATRNLIGIDPKFVRDPSDGGDGWGDRSWTPDVDESANDDYGDLRLTARSPAIDYGDDALAVDADGNPLATDADGYRRYYNGSPVDVGAVEFRGDVAAGREEPSLEVNTPEDIFDPYDGRVSLREAVYYAGAELLDRTVVFDGSLDGATLSVAGFPLWIDKQLTVDASSLTSLTIDGNHRTGVLAVIASDEDVVEFNDLTITGGKANVGGAIFNSGTLLVTNAMLVGNSADRGGGVFNSGTLAIVDSTFLGNSADHGGGAFNGGTVTITNGVFSGNVADGPGAGIYNDQATLTVTNCTFSGNSTAGGSYRGGGIYDRWGSLTLHNSILWQNDGGDLDVLGTISASHNLIQMDPGFVRDPSDGGDGWGDDPETPGIDESANDDFGDLRLTSESLAVDHGNNALAVDVNGDPLAADLDGNPRNYDGLAVDMGAYEFQGGVSGGREEPSSTVNTSEDVFDLYDGRVSLREAIYYAGIDSPETTITFDPNLDGATITLSGMSLWIDKPLTVDASSLDSLTIDAGGKSRAFTIVARDEDAVELNALTITGGSEHYGAAIFNSGTLTVLDSVILGNRASEGAVYSSDGALTVAYCTLSGNSSTYGGAISTSRGTLTVSGSRLSGNSAYYGGAIWSCECLLTVTTSTISGNSATTNGGGICHYGSGLVITLNNTIVAGNTAVVSGPDLYTDARRDGGILTGSHNLIGDGSGQTFENGIDGNLVGTPENPIDPLFVRASSGGGDGWGDDPNTPDVDESANDDYGDLRLRADSPAVNAGDNALLPPDASDLDFDGDTAEPIPFDLAGNYRVTGEAVDMGAYEYVVLSDIPGDLDNDGVVGADDLAIIRAAWCRSVIPGSLPMGDPSGDGRVDSIDLDIVRANWGRTTPAAAVPTERDDAGIVEHGSVYGPGTAAETAIPGRNRANRAAHAWADAIDSLARERRTSAQTPNHAAAVDLALLEWKK